MKVIRLFDMKIFISCFFLSGIAILPGQQLDKLTKDQQRSVAYAILNKAKVQFEGAPSSPQQARLFWGRWTASDLEMLKLCDAEVVAKVEIASICDILSSGDMGEAVKILRNKFGVVFSSEKITPEEFSEKFLKVLNSEIESIFPEELIDQDGHHILPEK